MKKYIIFILILTSSCNTDESANISTNDQLSGVWNGISYELDGTELFSMQVDSFSIDFRINTMSASGFLSYLRKSVNSNGVPSTLSEEMGYTVINENTLIGSIHDTVQFTLDGNVLSYSYTNRRGDEIGLILTR